jgi:hypothetical protein
MFVNGSGQISNLYRAVFTLNFLTCKFKYLQAHHQFYRPEFKNYINDH